jgi:hypothetical protein
MVGVPTGIFDAYDFKIGREIYRQRIPHQGPDSAHRRVVSDGKIELLKTNRMNEPVMATPAISGGTLIVRAQHQVYGIRRK